MHSAWMHRGTVLLVVLGMAVLGGIVRAQTGPLMVAPTDVKWVDGPPTLSPGVKMAVIHGDPSKAGLYAIQLKFPADFKVMPHAHPIDEHYTVLSGTVYFGIGEKFEPEKTKALPAGSVGVAPAQTPHFAWTKEETVIHAYGIGPTGLTYVNPADDPRKK